MDTPVTETSVEVPAAPVVVEGWWVNVAGTVVVLVLSGLWVVVRSFLKKIMVKMDLQEAEKQAVEALLDGMAAQQPIANAIKKAAADNKITKEEAAELEAKAWEVAKGAVTGPAKDIVMNWTTERVSSLIKQLLSKYKSD